MPCIVIDFDCVYVCLLGWLVGFLEYYFFIALFLFLFDNLIVLYVVHEQELQEMVDEADREGDGVINEDEFYRVMRKRENPLDEIDSDDDF